MSESRKIEAMWDDAPVDVSAEVNFIWSIANKLRGTYRSDKYKDVIIPMTIIRRFECALAATKEAVVAKYVENPKYPPKAMCRISGYSFYNTSRFTLAELLNDADHLADNFKDYLAGFSETVNTILMSKESGLNFGEEIDKMSKNGRLFSIVKAFSELDLDPQTIDNVKMAISLKTSSVVFLKTLKPATIIQAGILLSSWSISFWPRAVTIFTRPARSLPSWTRLQAQAVCSLRPTILSNAITPMRTFTYSVRKSTLNPTPFARPK